MPLQELLQLVEHSGCASGRARAVLIFAEQHSANTITRCPAQFIARELPPSPYIPQPLRTSYPPRVPPLSGLSGYLNDEQERRLKNEIDNLLVDVANMFHRAEHPQSFDAARAYLANFADTARWMNYQPRSVKGFSEEISPYDEADQVVLSGL